MRRVEAAGWMLEIPETHVERTRGLLGRDALDPTHAFVLARCRSVHSVGMRFPIDIVAFDAEWSVVHIRALPPGRIGWPRRGARHIVETAAGRGHALSASLDGRTIREALGIDPPRT
jgi:uncharacterized membrane protein (UPF0127 family)